jgi:hypothetical protein
MSIPAHWGMGMGLGFWLWEKEISGFHGAQRLQTPQSDEVN